MCQFNDYFHKVADCESVLPLIYINLFDHDFWPWVLRLLQHNIYVWNILKRIITKIKKPVGHGQYAKVLQK